MNLAGVFQRCCKLSEKKAIIFATIFVNVLDIVTDLILISTLANKYKIDGSRNTLILLICLSWIWIYSCYSQARFLWKLYESWKICLIAIFNLGSVFFVIKEYKKINDDNVKDDGIITKDEELMDETFIKLVRFFWETEALSEGLPMCFLQLPLLILISLSNATTNDRHFIKAAFGSDVLVIVFTIISSFLSLFGLGRQANLYWQFVNIDNDTEERDEITVTQGFQLRGCSACFIVWDILAKMLVHATIAILILFPYYNRRYTLLNSLPLFDEGGVVLLIYLGTILAHQLWIFYFPVKKLVNKYDAQFKDPKTNKLLLWIQGLSFSIFCFCCSPSLLSIITYVHRSVFFAKLLYAVNFTLVSISVIIILVLSGVFLFDTIDEFLLIVFIYFFIACVPYLIFGGFICLFEFKICGQGWLIKDDTKAPKIIEQIENVAELVVNGPDADKKWDFKTKSNDDLLRNAPKTNNDTNVTVDENNGQTNNVQ